jgi:hypothetical protein
MAIGTRCSCGGPQIGVVGDEMSSSDRKLADGDLGGLEPAGSGEKPQGGYNWASSVWRRRS